jgi:hypothetical protein
VRRDKLRSLPHVEEYLRKFGAPGRTYKRVREGDGDSPPHAADEGTSADLGEEAQVLTASGDGGAGGEGANDGGETAVFQAGRPPDELNIQLICLFSCIDGVFYCQSGVQEKQNTRKKCMRAGHFGMLLIS